MNRWQSSGGSKLVSLFVSCLFNCVLRLTTRKQQSSAFLSLCSVTSHTDAYPLQWVSDAGSISISRRHQVVIWVTMKSSPYICNHSLIIAYTIPTQVHLANVNHKRFNRIRSHTIQEKFTQMPLYPRTYQTSGWRMVSDERKHGTISCLKKNSANSTALACHRYTHLISWQ